MKKFNFKTILILVLTLILVFSLVACNKDQGPAEDPGTPTPTGDPNAIKSEQFFTDLWAASNSIGSTEIKSGDSIGLTADLALKVKIKDKKETYKEIDLGIALQLVLDRKNGGADSAAKIKLYNADTKANWLTLYYFLNDKDFIYIDYQGKNIKFNFNFGWNDQIPGMFDDALNAELFPGTSILDIVEEITETTGSEFNLNNLVNTILGLVKEAAGFDISKLVNDNRELLETTLGIKGILDANNNVNLQAVFNSSIIKSFLKNSKCVPQTDGSKAYSTDIVLSTTITGALSGMLGDFGSILKGIGINLSFGTAADGSMDGFKITVDLPGLQATDGIIGKPMYPSVEIAINNLEFVPVEAAKADKYLGIDTSKYNGDVAIDIALELDSKGITITPNAIDPNGATKNAPASVSLDGKYVLGIQGNMDLSKLDEEGNCYLYVFLEKVGTEAKPVELLYDGKEIILTYDASVNTSDGNSIVASIINSVGKLICDGMDGMLDHDAQEINPLLGQVLTADYTLLTEGAKTYITLDMDLENLLKYVVNNIGNMFEFYSEADTECQYPFTMSSLATIVKDAITAIDTTDGLGVALPGKTIAGIMATWFKWDKKTLPVTTETEREVLYARAIAYNQNWFETFKGLGFFQDAKYTDYNSLTKADTELMWKYASKYGAIKYGADNYDASRKAVFDEYSEDAAVTGTKAEAEVFYAAMEKLAVYFGDKVVNFAACPEAHWTEAVFNYLKTASVNISLDNGFVITVKAGMDTTTSATLKLSASANTSLTRAAMKAVYDAKAAEITTANELDLGEVVFGIDKDGKWYASGQIPYAAK